LDLDLVTASTRFIHAVDLVVITAPSGLHYDLCKRTLLAGKHVLCEKPVTTTEAEALDLIDVSMTVWEISHYTVIRLMV
jgi:predicted dehydrogenase